MVVISVIQSSDAIERQVGVSVSCLGLGLRKWTFQLHEFQHGSSGRHSSISYLKLGSPATSLCETTHGGCSFGAYEGPLRELKLYLSAESQNVCNPVTRVLKQRS